MRKFTEDHECLQRADGVATVGITTHAVEQLGDLVYVELPKVGAVLGKGDAAAINADPEGAAWFFRLKLSDPKSLDGLLDQDAYRKLVG